MSKRFDLCVIGCGVVGLAILRRFALAGLKTIALEKGTDILSGASKGNSALLHTGFDAPPKSLELSCMQAGNAEFHTIRHRLNLPLLETGAIVAAWTPEELEKLGAIEAKAIANGVSDVKRLSQLDMRIREPQLMGKPLGGLYVPGEHVIDPWSTPLAYAQQALNHGAQIWREAEVIKVTRLSDCWQLHTPKGQVEASIVVNAAGLYGDHVEALAFEPTFQIKPRKGQFVVFDKPASKLLRSILLPVPTERTKGVVIFRTIFGNLAIGPTAEETDEREDPKTDAATLPALKDIDVTATYAGLRPATSQQDYIIKAKKDEAWITVASIRSTGLTAALGIAQYVEKLYVKNFGKLGKNSAGLEVYSPVPNLAEHGIRPYMKGGEIICHCEWVTRVEVQAACRGKLPAKDLSGVKRRTRAGLGRCQGFYCAALVADELAKAKNGTP